MHRTRIHVEMLERYVRIILRNARHSLPPKLRRLEHVRFVYRRHFTATFARRFKRHARFAATTNRLQDVDSVAIDRTLESRPRRVTLRQTRDTRRASRAAKANRTA